MRVLFTANLPSPYRMDFFNELGRYCDLTVCFERKGAKDRDPYWFAAEACHFIPVFLRGMPMGNDSAFCPSIAGVLRRGRYDLIVVGGYSTPTGMLAIETLRLKRIPFVLNCDGGFIKNDSIIKSAVKRHFIGGASWWLSTGDDTSRYLVFYGANPKNIHIYPFTSVRRSDMCSAPADDTEKTALREELSIPGKRAVIGVGQFIRRKGFDTALHAWRRMPEDITLILIGSGPEVESYQSLISMLGLPNVRMVGFQNKESLKKYYRAADLFLMPTREDIWGLVVNEAMACGLPVLTTHAALSAHELVREGENGFVIPPDDSKAMSDKLTAMLKNPEGLYEMGRRSLEIINGHTIENMARIHLDIFNQIISGSEREV